jgi:flagellar protein FliL
MKPVLVLSTVLTIAGTGLTTWLYGAGHLDNPFGQTLEQTEVAVSSVAALPSEPLYLPLDPPFLVNFEMDGKLRFLQVSIELMTRDRDATDALKSHMPLLRNNILMILSEQSLATVLTRAAKQALRDEILNETRQVMQTVSGSPGVEAVYFTSFVMQ